MLSKVISLGDRLELIRPMKMQKNANEDEEKIRPYISQVYDILDGEQLKIAMPIVNGRVIPLPQNARYAVTFYTSGGLYKSMAVVTDRYKEDGLFILIIELTAPLKKYQRRQYYRLEHTMDVYYKCITEEEMKIATSDENEMIDMLESGVDVGIVVDISGGGMRFTTTTPIEPNSYILVKINIGTVMEENYGMLAYVISSVRSEKRDRIFVNRVEFKNIQNVVRERLIKFIFDTERRNRKNS